MRSYKAVKVFGFVILMGVLVGCGLFDADVDGDGNGTDPVSATITVSEGGSIRTSDGKLTMAFPAGAVTEDTEVTIAPVSAQSGSFGYDLQPDGLQLQAPATLTSVLNADDLGEVLDRNGNPVDFTKAVPGIPIILENSDGTKEALDNIRIISEHGSGEFTTTAELTHFSRVWLFDNNLATIMTLLYDDNQTVGSVFQPIEAAIEFPLSDLYESANVDTVLINAMSTVSVAGSAVLPGGYLDDSDPYIEIKPSFICIEDGTGGIEIGAKVVAIMVLDDGSELFLPYIHYLPGFVECVATMKLLDVYVAALVGDFTHYVGYSVVSGKLYVVMEDPEPAPGAMVTVKLTNPDDSAETQKVTTDVNGEATVDFTISEYGTYKMEVTDITGPNMRYTPEKNSTSSVTLEVDP